MVIPVMFGLFVVLQYISALDGFGLNSVPHIDEGELKAE
jgi:hypothetical protein